MNYKIAVTQDLSPTDLAMQGLPVFAAFAFDGEIDGSRFRAVIESALMEHRFLQAEIKNGRFLLSGETNKACIDDYYSYEKYSHHVDQLDFYLSKNKGPFSNAIPSLRKGVLFSIRLTVFDGSFTIGVSWDHGFCDLTGIAKLISHLSKTYNEDNSRGILSFSRFSPFAQDENLYREASSVSRNAIAEISYLKALTQKCRFVSAQARSKNALVLLKGTEIEGIKRDCLPNRVSDNDIITAFLLRLYFRSYLAPKLHPMTLVFPVNARGRFGIEDYGICNCVANASSKFMIAEKSQLGLGALAVFVRSIHAALDIDTVKSDEMWKLYWSRRATKSQICHNWLFNTDRLYVSSWANNDLLSVAFGDAKFLTILRPMNMNNFFKFPWYHSTVLPQRTSEGLQYCVRITLPAQDIPVFHEYCLSDNLVVKHFVMC